MKVKVCGMKHPENIREVAELDIDFMGFIFYKKSPRFAEISVETPPHVQRVGVFVNEPQQDILHKIDQFDLNIIQLHGRETVTFCEELRQKLKVAGQIKVKLWKVFSIASKKDLDTIDNYTDAVDGILLDTKGKYRGGNGEKFDWNFLKHHHFTKPVILSGGIGAEDTVAVMELFNQNLINGIDINSGFEDSPGRKNKKLINTFLKNLKSYEQV